MIQRVNGSLAVSRALGDFEYKNVDGKGPTEQLGEQSNCRLRPKRIQQEEWKNWLQHKINVFKPDFPISLLRNEPESTIGLSKSQKYIQEMEHF